MFSTESPAWSAQTLSLTLLPVVLLPIAAGIFVYVCHRRGKVRQHEKRFQYIEVRKWYCDIKNNMHIQ